MLWQTAVHLIEQLRNISSSVDKIWICIGGIIGCWVLDQLYTQYRQGRVIHILMEIPLANAKCLNQRFPSYWVQCQRAEHWSVHGDCCKKVKRIILFIFYFVSPALSTQRKEGYKRTLNLWSSSEHGTLGPQSNAWHGRLSAGWRSCAVWSPLGCICWAGINTIGNNLHTPYGKSTDQLKFYFRGH